MDYAEDQRDVLMVHGAGLVMLSSARGHRGTQPAPGPRGSRESLSTASPATSMTGRAPAIWPEQNRWQLTRFRSGTDQGAPNT
jgi:hypothetical protein